MNLLNMKFGKLALSAFLLTGVLAASSAGTLASTRDNKPKKQNTASKTMTASTAKPHKKSAAKKKRRHARTSKAASPKKS